VHVPQGHPQSDVSGTNLRDGEGLQLRQLLAGGVSFDPGSGQYEGAEDKAHENNGDGSNPGDLNGCGAGLLVRLQNDNDH
jgi:hypothetical protein